MIGEDDGDEGDAEMTVAEQKQIESKIQHIHRWHGSLKNLASLKRRGVPGVS